MSGAFGYDQSQRRSDQRVDDATPQQIKTLLNPFRDQFLRLFGEKGGDPLSGIPQSPQSQTGYSAPATAAETQALADIQAQTGPGTARSGVIEDTLSGKFTDPASNPFLTAFTKAQQDETARRYEEVLGRTLPGQFTQAGHSVQPGGSSPFDRAAAIQSEGLARELGNIATGIGFNAYEAERGRQMEAVRLDQQEIDTSIKNLQAQALPRLIEQFGLDQGLAEFQQRTEQLLGLLSLLSGGVLTSGQEVLTASHGDSMGFKTSGGAYSAPSI